MKIVYCTICLDKSVLHKWNAGEYKQQSFKLCKLYTIHVKEKLIGMTIGYEYKTDTDTSNILRDVVTNDLHLVWKINHEIFNIPQWLPLHFKIDIKLQLPPSNFIL